MSDGEYSKKESWVPTEHKREQLTDPETASIIEHDEMIRYKIKIHPDLKEKWKEEKERHKQWMPEGIQKAISHIIDGPDAILWYFLFRRIDSEAFMRDMWEHVDQDDWIRMTTPKEKIDELFYEALDEIRRKALDLTDEEIKELSKDFPSLWYRVHHELFLVSPGLESALTERITKLKLEEPDRIYIPHWRLIDSLLDAHPRQDLLRIKEKEMDTREDLIKSLTDIDAIDECWRRADKEKLVEKTVDERLQWFKSNIDPSWKHRKVDLLKEYLKISSDVEIMLQK